MQTQQYSTVIPVYDGRIEYYPRVIKVVAGAVLYYIPILDWTVVNSHILALDVYQRTIHPDCEDDELYSVLRNEPKGTLKAYCTGIKLPGQSQQKVIQIADIDDNMYVDMCIVFFDLDEFHRNIDEVVLKR